MDVINNANKNDKDYLKLANATPEDVLLNKTFYSGDETLKTGTLIASGIKLEDATWEDIAEISSTGRAIKFWDVGDEKNIIVNGETLTLVILGFNHDDLTSGGKAGITFGMKHLMKDTQQMNYKNANLSGFTSSGMYTWLKNTLPNQLPSDLLSVIKAVDKKNWANYAVNTDSMRIFLFSEEEVFGAKTFSYGGEGTQYSYFATAANRIKNLQNGAGSANWWWERSPRPTNSTDFCCVNADGSVSNTYATNVGGVCFGFCV